MLNHCNKWPGTPGCNLFSLVVIKKEDPMHWKTDLSLSSCTDCPNFNPEKNANRERKGRRPVEPLEHLVADLVLNMILFLNLIQWEIYNNSRKNENCFLLYHLVWNYASLGHLFFVSKNVPYVYAAIQSLLNFLSSPTKHWLGPHPSHNFKAIHLRCPTKDRKSVSKHPTESSLVTGMIWDFNSPGRFK